jgi:hypothetical protein
MSVSRLLIAALLTASLAATVQPDDLPPGVLKAAKAVTVNRELVKHVAKFTCLETIRRSDLARNQRSIKDQDVIQVEVAVGGGREVFSWPGQDNFSDSELGQIVGHGMLATGLFQSMVNTVFAGNAAAIHWIGEGALHGHPAYRFRYKVPSFLSRWQVDWLGARGIVGEEGEFWVDASQFTLLRLAVDAVDIPAALPLQHLEIVIDYRPESIGTAKTLLPESAGIVAVEWSGALHRAEVSFSHCRVFGAESTLLLSAADLVKEVSQFQKSRELLPAGLTLPLTLETPIDSAIAMVGDNIRARLEKTIALPDNSIIPQGAMAEGYLRQMERFNDGGSSYYQVGLEFDRMLWPGHSADFFADSLSSLPEVRRSRGVQSGHRGNWLTTESQSETILPIHIPGVASLVLEGDRVHVAKGFRIVWRTRAPARSRDGTK